MKAIKKVCASLFAAALLAAAAPAVAAKTCAAMKKELTELRREYHQYATSKVNESGEAVNFDKLAEILDKIVELKREMTAEKCQIPPRDRDLKGKK
jgi:hypothetical protein